MPPPVRLPGDPARAGTPLVAALLAACAAPDAVPDAPGVPRGYRLAYSQDFSYQGSLADLCFTDESAWEWGMGNPEAAAPRTFLDLAAASDYGPPHRSPLSIALVQDLVVGDFVLELKAKQTGREYGHRDLCIVFGHVDPAHFYYVHLAPAPDAHAHNVFLVDGADRQALAEVPDEGVDWGDEWHVVRVERELATGLVQVFFDDATEPLLEAVDTTLGAGRIGFGSFDDTGRFTDVKVWAPDPRR